MCVRRDGCGICELISWIGSLYVRAEGRLARFPIEDPAQVALCACGGTSFCSIATSDDFGRSMCVRRDARKGLGSNIDTRSLYVRAEGRSERSSITRSAEVALCACGGTFRWPPPSLATSGRSMCVRRDVAPVAALGDLVGSLYVRAEGRSFPPRRRPTPAVALCACGGTPGHPHRPENQLGRSMCVRRDVWRARSPGRVAWSLYVRAEGRMMKVMKMFQYPVALCACGGTVGRNSRDQRCMGRSMCVRRDECAIAI
jgi:hypothetical protein